LEALVNQTRQIAISCCLHVNLSLRYFTANLVISVLSVLINPRTLSAL
jgi:hypothetical protein